MTTCKHGLTEIMDQKSEHCTGTEQIKLGGYRLIETLGHGGFSTVYRAIQESTGQQVAIKVLQLNESQNEEAHRRKIERFERETQLCAELNHPNIVRLLDKGQHTQNHLYAVFEFVPGETLKNLLQQQGSMPAPYAGELMGQVLDALACAHAKGVVHRDLKPQNIMITITGTRPHVKVLDFGIGAFIPDKERVDYKSLTLTLEAVGTPSYSAPEQLRGEPPTISSDLYAWGLVFLECLTGHPTMQGASLAEIFHKQLSPADVPLPPAISDHPLGSLLRRVLQKSPLERTDSALRVYADFKELNLNNVVGDLYADYSVPLITNQDTDSNEKTEVSLAPWGQQASERRQITVLCFSLGISTPDNSEFDFEPIETLLKDQISFCTDIGIRYGGHLAGILGNFVMLYFGYPFVSDNDARRAARTALEMSMKVRHRNILLQEKQGVELNLSVGIHTGKIVVTSDNQPSGLTPNIAMQLAGIAMPGTVLSSETTRHLLQNYIEFEEAQHPPLKAGSSPLTSYLMVGERKSEALSFMRSRNSIHPLVGRSHEYETLCKLWSIAKTDHNTTALITGEAGIGKSRIVHELRLNIQNEGLPTYECQCLPEQRNNALYPILEMIKNRLGLDETNCTQESIKRLSTALQQCQVALGEVLPVFCSWLSLPPPEDIDPSQLSPDKQKHLILETLKQLVLKAEPAHPFLLVVEDIHWADPTTIDFLKHLIEHQSKEKFLLVLTARPELPPQWDKQNYTQLHLQRLALTEAEKMVCLALEDRPVDKKTIAWLCDRTDGIPLFVEELTRTLLENGLLIEREGTYTLDENVDSSDIPVTLQDSLNERLCRLGPAVETAQLAATIGREFDYHLLSAASLRDEANLQVDLNTLIAADLIYNQRRVQGESYIFKHALIRDAAYDAMLKVHKEQAHARIAHALETHTENTPDNAALAWHFSNASEYEKAIPNGIAAAKSSLEKALSLEAITHSENVLAWLKYIDISQRTAHELSVNCILNNAMMSQYGWADSRVKALAERSRQLLENCNNDQQSIQAMWVLAIYHHVASNRQDVRRLSEEMVAIAQRTDDTGLSVAAHTMLGHSYWIDGQYLEAKHALEFALSHYDSNLNSNHGVMFGVDSYIWSLSGMAVITWFTQANKELAFKYAQDSVEYAKKLNHIPSLGIALTYLAMMYQYTYDREGAAGACSELLQLCEKYGLPASQAYGAIIYSWATQNKEELQHTLAMLRTLGCALGLTQYDALVADLEFLSNEHETALKTIDSSLALCDEIDEHYYQAELLLQKATILEADLDSNYDLVIPILNQSIQYARKSGSKKTENACLQKLHEISNPREKYLTYS